MSVRFLSLVAVMAMLVGMGQCIFNGPSVRMYYPEVERDVYDALHDELSTEMFFGVATNELALLPDMRNDTHVSEWKIYTDSVELMLAYERFYHIRYGSVHACALQSHQVRAAIDQNYLCTIKPVYGAAESIEEFVPLTGYRVYGITDAALRRHFDSDLSSQGKTAVGATYDPHYPMCEQTDDQVCHQLYDYLHASPNADHAPMEEAWAKLEAVSVKQGAKEAPRALEHVFICWDSVVEGEVDPERIPPIARFLLTLEDTVHYEPLVMV